MYRNIFKSTENKSEYLSLEPVKKTLKNILSLIISFKYKPISIFMQSNVDLKIKEENKTDIFNPIIRTLQYVIKHTAKKEK